MKTKLLQKQKKQKHFFSEFGIYNFGKVSSVIIKLIIFSLVYQFVFLVYISALRIEHMIKNSEFIFSIYFSKLYSIYSSLTFVDLSNLKVNIFLAPIYILSFYIVLSIYMYHKSKLQLKLSNLGLENYTVKKINNGFIFKLVCGEEIEFDYALNIKDDIKQIFNIQSDTYISRFRKKDIKIELKNDFPNTILDYIDIYKKLQSGKVYLGYKLVNNKLVNNYIDFDNFQRVSITGTSGGGKSNLINLVIYNLLFNINNIEQIIFCDFKGGLESEPLMRVVYKYNLNIIACSNLESLHDILHNISQSNDERMEHNKINNLKKYSGKSIYIIYDEFAQIGLYNAVKKEEKELHKSVMCIYSRLHATGRSQKIYNITITQSFLQNSSGIPSDVKTNLDTNIMLKTDNNQSIQSVFSSDELEDNGFNPKILNVGEFILKNKGELVECKAMYVPDDIEKYFDSIVYKNLQKNIDSELFIERPNHSKVKEFVYDVFNFYKTNKYYMSVRFNYLNNKEEYILQKNFYEEKYKK